MSFFLLTNNKNMLIDDFKNALPENLNFKEDAQEIVSKNFKMFYLDTPIQSPTFSSIEESASFIAFAVDYPSNIKDLTQENTTPLIRLLEIIKSSKNIKDVLSKLTAPYLIIWKDLKNDCFILLSDLFGVSPLFTYKSNSTIILSNKLRLIQKNVITLEVIPEQILFHLAFKFYTEGFTGLKHINRATSGQFINIHSKYQIQIIEKFEHLSLFKTIESQDDQMIISDLSSRLSYITNNISQLSNESTRLALTGGYDSRLSAAAFLSNSKRLVFYINSIFPSFIKYFPIIILRKIEKRDPDVVKAIELTKAAGTDIKINRSSFLKSPKNFNSLFKKYANVFSHELTMTSLKDLRHLYTSYSTVDNKNKPIRISSKTGGSGRFRSYMPEFKDYPQLEYFQAFLEKNAENIIFELAHPKLIKAINKERDRYINSYLNLNLNVLQTGFLLQTFSKALSNSRTLYRRSGMKRELLWDPVALQLFFHIHKNTPPAPSYPSRELTSQLYSSWNGISYIWDNIKAKRKTFVKVNTLINHRNFWNKIKKDEILTRIQSSYFFHQCFDYQAFIKSKNISKWDLALYCLCLDQSFNQSTR